MNFDEITLEGSTSVKLFDLRNPRSTPYIVRTIDGLGPTDVDVTLAQTSQGQGIYIGRREQLREITINAFLNPNYTISESPEILREAIYRLRPINGDLSLDLNIWKESIEVATTPVYVKRVEIVPFSKEQVVQIVLASTSGYLRKRTPITLLDQTYDKVNPVFVNSGSADTGFYLDIDFTSTANNFGLVQSAPTANLTVSKFVGDTNMFTTGDKLEIDTNIGSRGVWRTRGGSRVSILGNLAATSTWLSLRPGSNTLHIITDATPAGNFWWKKFIHTPKFTGV